MKRLSLVMVITALTLAACGGAQPKPGATFTGPIEIGTDKASSATLSFTVSEDGIMITEVSVSLTEVKCDGMSSGMLMLRSAGDFDLSGSNLNISPSNIGEIKGRFTSPTEASGTVKLSLKIDVLGSTFVCDLGTWNWHAEAP